jgi:short-subunit dehydrogenase
MKITDFKKRVAYITGGSSGIGLAAAKLLAARGASVIIFARQVEALKNALGEIEKCRVSPEQKFSCKPLDVAQREMTVEVLSGAVKEFGEPDILINSAGISYPQKFEDTDYKKFDDIIKVNLYGTWSTVNVLLPYLKQKKGYIVNVSSIAGFIGVFAMTSYSASKFGVIGFSEALRSELKPCGVNVSVLCPPDVSTPMLEKSNQIKPEEAKAISAGADIMTAEAVAKALLRSMAKDDFLVIPNSSGRFTNVMKRLFPGLTEWIVDGTIRKVQQKACKP